MAVAFSGVRSFSGMATGGSRLCGVLACTGDDVSSCGKRFANYTRNTTAVFEDLTIAASVPTPVTVPELAAHDSIFFPVSMDVSIMPLEPKDISYTVNHKGATTEFTLKLNNANAELYTFAMWGRVFERDGEDATQPGSSFVCFVDKLLILIAVFLSISIL